MAKVFLGAVNGKTQSMQAIIKSRFKSAGLIINGSNDADPQIHREGFYARLVRDGDLGLGESYMEAWWDCKALDQLIAKLVTYRRRCTAEKASYKELFYFLKAFLRPAGRLSQAYNIADKHYNLDNELYAAMLDRRMTYSCGLWGEKVQTLDQAQAAKLDLICKKLKLEPGMTVLDCGSGWGSFAGYAAEHYGVDVTGVSVSGEQVNYANKRYYELPVRFLLEDYRQHQGCYDRIVSIGMIEHVGPKYYRMLIEKMRSCLTDEGLFLLHTIGNNHSQFRQDWIVKYIFPEGFVPSLSQLSAAVENSFVIEDVENLSVNYDTTLMAWYANFNSYWQQLSDKYDEQFYRMWKFYLLSCAAMFRARELQLYQLLLSPYGLANGYRR